MARTSTVITTNTTTQIASVALPHAGNSGYIASVAMFGTFGSTTITLSLSTDGGTTKTGLKDLTGTAYSITAADVVSIGPIGAIRDVGATLLYAVTTGGSGASITVTVDDNL